MKRLFGSKKKKKEAPVVVEKKYDIKEHQEYLNNVSDGTNK